MWFYSIRGSANRLVKKSDAIYATEQEAIAAGTEYLKSNKASVHRASDPNEIFSVMARRG